MKSAMISARFRNLLTMLVAMLVITASSQAAVCELACGVEIEKMSCHSHAASAAMANSAPEMMGMADSHCAHEMTPATMQVSMQACDEGSCSHTSMPVLAKAGPSAVAQFAAVQWVAVGVVPVQLHLVSRAGFGLRPPLPATGADPLVVSLRV